MLDNERIKELQRMTKKELIDLIDQLERDKYFLNKEKNMYKGWYEKTEQEREEIYNDMVRYREERAELMDKLYLKKEKIYVEEVKRLARQGYKLKEHNERHAGRKNKFNKEQEQQIIEARNEGKSIRAIAKEFECSIGLVHKLINKK